MPCTTILAGKKATYDGSTMMARNEDSGSGHFTAKKFIAVLPADQPKLYKSVISKVEIPLPEKPLRYTAVPNALPDEGIWGEAGVNELNVAMSETETITSNARVQGADPLVKTGIGEEDLLTITLPYIRSAREGVLRLGRLTEEYGTYEMNGVGFQDTDEVWWFETVGGHHWIAKRVPDECYVVMPNQMGIDSLDLADAYGEKKNNLCSADLIDFIRENSLDLSYSKTPLEKRKDFDTRAAFGSHDDSDHKYNTPRAWIMHRYLQPSRKWDGPDAEYGPEDDDLPWSGVPERKITVEDVKYVLSSHFQGTDYDVYERTAEPRLKGKYRPIGINRNNFVALTQLRAGVPKELAAIQWIAMGSNVFNAFVPFYTHVDKTPEYFACTGAEVTTDSFYWANRLIGALSDAHMPKCSSHIERYQNRVHAEGHRRLKEAAAAFGKVKAKDRSAWLEQKNREMADFAKEETGELLDKVLYEASCEMKNGFSRSDA